MNWTGNMKCEDADQILLLLKSSDCITHDLTEPFDHCEDKHTNLANVEYYLVLRKWKSIHPASEFRCFVSHDKLIGQFSSPLSPNSPLISRTTGVTQRYHDQYFQYLHDFVPRITKQLEEFFAKKMKGLFPSHTCRWRESEGELVQETKLGDGKMCLMCILKICRRGTPLWCFLI